MDTGQGKTFTILRLIAERTNLLRFPDLPRPPVSPSEPATGELVSWGARVYSFSWTRHVSTLLNGIITLTDSRNTPSAIVVARSVFELGAHAYYVEKHLKQHMDLRNLDAAWKFLGPIQTGSRYINERLPEESDMFPEPAHIRRVVNCLSEALPSAAEDYSFLSEYCHPNMLAFLQYYRWANPFEVRFVDHEAQGVFGSTTAACLSGLMAIQHLLGMAQEETVRLRLTKLLKDIAAGSGRWAPA